MSLSSLVLNKRANALEHRLGKAPKHMLTVKAWAKQEGTSERTTLKLLTALCEAGDFVAAPYPVKMFSGVTRPVPHYGPRKA